MTSRRLILERRAAFIAAALAVAGPCDRTSAREEREEQAPATQPKECLGMRHVPLPGPADAKTDS